MKLENPVLEIVSALAAAIYFLDNKLSFIER